MGNDLVAHMIEIEQEKKDENDRATDTTDVIKSKFNDLTELKKITGEFN